MFAASITTALILLAPAPKEKVHSVVGTWQIESYTWDGRTTPHKETDCWTFTSDGKRGFHQVGSEPSGWIRFELNNKTRTWTLDLVAETAMGEYRECFLIEIDGDTLRMCTKDGKLPPALSAEKNSGCQIYTLKRVPPKN